MSTTDSTKCDRLKVAVAKMVALPGLIVKDAMKLADFSIQEREDKKMQQKVLRGLPGKGKRCMKELMSVNAEEGSIMQSIDVDNINNSDVSPITDDSATKQMQKSRRLTVSQKQEQRVSDFVGQSTRKHTRLLRLFIRSSFRLRGGCRDFVQAAPKFTSEQWAIMNAERDRHATNQGLGGDP